jgi:hypothetical protein
MFMSFNIIFHIQCPPFVLREKKHNGKHGLSDSDTIEWLLKFINSLTVRAWVKALASLKCKTWSRAAMLRARDKIF